MALRLALKLALMLAFAVSASFAAVHPAMQLPLQPQVLPRVAPISTVTAVNPVASPGGSTPTSASARLTQIAAATGDIPKPVQSVKTDKPATSAGVGNQAVGKNASPSAPLGTAQNTALSAPQKPHESKPLWAALSPAQQVSLKPLAANWASLTEAHKRKWIAFAQNYPKMSPADQSRLHSRMTEWVMLSPQQRTQARFNFAETKKLSASEKASTWQAYQALSAEEKQRLASQGSQAPPGATSAVKPIPAQKLAVVPSTRKDVKPAQVAANQPSVAPNTLLPRSQGPDSGSSATKN